MLRGRGVSERVLVTGGAGFIGRFVTEELLRRGNHVRVLDSLIPQVHGQVDGSEMLHPDAELIRADVRDGDAVARALDGVDSVVHLAAEVGVGQSMYEVERYTSTNDVGTAVLFEKLIDKPVRRVVTASSMSIYGEGLYRDADGDTVEDADRPNLRDGLTQWDPTDGQGRPLTPMATPEWKRPALSSIYALNKYVQERTTHIMGAPYGIESVCLRLFNVYGPGQALSNPYTGVLAIFASRLLNGQQPMIFEDRAPPRYRWRGLYRFQPRRPPARQRPSRPHLRRAQPAGYGEEPRMAPIASRRAARLHPRRRPRSRPPARRGCGCGRRVPPRGPGRRHHVDG